MRRLLLLSALGPGLLGAACSDGGAPPARPSVVLITLDTTRADHLGCYGYGRPTSPNLDRLAREGVRFDLCISSSAVTPVSHASILTGLYPYNHGLRVLFAASGYQLPQPVRTLAQDFQDAGYETGAFLSAFPVSEEFGFQRGFDAFDNGLEGEAEGVIGRPEGDEFAMWDTSGNQRRSERTTERALAWLDGVEGPFFLWIHYWDPHDGHLLPPDRELLQRFAPGLDLDNITSWIVPLYDAEIAWVDRSFGALRDGLERRGRWDDTVVAVTADHGEGWGEHDWHAHRILYQEQIHLPLIVAGPGVPEGDVVADLVRSVDVHPTLLELAGLEIPRGLDGRSLTGLMRGLEEPPRLAYADQLNKWDTNAKMLAKRPQDDLLHVLMDRRWKLIHRPLRPDESELYDLERDPDEAVNLYRPDHPEALRLRAELEARRPFRLEPFGDVDETSATAERLRQLGYLEK